MVVFIETFIQRHRSDCYWIHVIEEQVGGGGHLSHRCRQEGPKHWGSNPMPFA